MDYEDYYLLRHKVINLESYIRNKPPRPENQITPRPHTKLNKLIYHINKCESSIDSEERTYHFQKSKEIFHELKYQHSIIYMLRCKMKRLLLNNSLFHQ